KLGIFSVIGIFLAAALVVQAARATMITWITVLVLLACSGRRRQSLGLDGKKITIDVAPQFVEVLVSEEPGRSCRGLRHGHEHFSQGCGEGSL
uniref:Uncharacterized protein n=1 Tax=Kalanchoe fedtschenkoi TaxID=63787 RepID=A0A7N0UW88_KALFE